ncbi:MAG: hypothetical protein AAF211_12760 [Myxococcota bacterium]
MSANYQALAVHFDSVAAATAEQREVAWPFPGTWRVESVFVAPSTTAAANGTNFTTVALEANDGQAGSYTRLGQLDTSSVPLTVGTRRAMAMDASVSQEIAQGHLLRIDKSNDGTGAMFDGGVTVLASRVD